MGVGMPADIIAAVMAGVDMFDCVLPTRNGRNAYAFTMNGPLRMRNNEHINDAGPIERDCDCYACGQFFEGGNPPLLQRGRDDGADSDDDSQPAVLSAADERDKTANREGRDGRVG